MCACWIGIKIENVFERHTTPHQIICADILMQKLRESIVRVIFSALDQDKDGLVDKRDLYNWVNNESAFWGIISSTATPAEKARSVHASLKNARLWADHVSLG